MICHPERSRRVCQLERGFDFAQPDKKTVKKSFVKVLNFDKAYKNLSISAP